MQTSKYLLANERDKEWGLTVSTVGHEIIEPGEPYPTKGHADGYYFDLKKGRELDEYQLLYQPEGEGVFQSAHIAETPIKLALIHISEPTRQAEIAYAGFCLKKKDVFCLKKKKKKNSIE